MKTCAAYLKSPWQFELREVSLPDSPPPGWIRLRVQACGICGTDLSAASQTADWRPFGHESAGIIAAVGSGVDDLAVGDCVALQSSAFCGRCAVCRNGRPDLCRSSKETFWGQPAMGFSTYFDAPASHAVKYSGMVPEVAALAEPLGVAFDMVQTADIRLGQYVCIVGPGPIALGALALARNRGAARLVCVGHSHSKARLALAGRLGAEIMEWDSPLAECEKLKDSFDHVLVTAPAAEIPSVIAWLRYGGIITYIGIGTGSGNITIDANEFHFRKLQLRSSFASPAMYLPVVLDLLRAGILPGDTLISHRYPLSQIAEAMHTAGNDKANAIKVMVTAGEDYRELDG